jgi:hypothetical protein
MKDQELRELAGLLSTENFQDKHPEYALEWLKSHPYPVAPSPSAAFIRAVEELVKEVNKAIDYLDKWCPALSARLQSVILSLESAKVAPPDSGPKVSVDFAQNECEWREKEIAALETAPDPEDVKRLVDSVKHFLCGGDHYDPTDTSIDDIRAALLPLQKEGVKQNVPAPVRITMGEINRIVGKIFDCYERANEKQAPIRMAVFLREKGMEVES